MGKTTKSTTIMVTSILANLRMESRPLRSVSHHVNLLLFHGGERGQLITTKQSCTSVLGPSTFDFRLVCSFRAFFFLSFAIGSGETKNLCTLAAVILRQHKKKQWRRIFTAKTEGNIEERGRIQVRRFGQEFSVEGSLRACLAMPWRGC